MNPRLHQFAAGLALIAGISGLAGCRTWTTSSPPREDVLTMVDVQGVAETLADDMVAGFFQRQQHPPIVVMIGIDNETPNLLDTVGLADQIRHELVRSRCAQFVKPARLAQALNAYKGPLDFAATETRKLIGMQLGARYLMQGTLLEKPVEPAKKPQKPNTTSRLLHLNIELIDLENGTTAWHSLREVEQPVMP